MRGQYNLYKVLLIVKDEREKAIMGDILDLPALRHTDELYVATQECAEGITKASTLDMVLFSSSVSADVRRKLETSLIPTISKPQPVDENAAFKELKQDSETGVYNVGSLE